MAETVFTVGGGNAAMHLSIVAKFMRVGPKGSARSKLGRASLHSSRVWRRKSRRFKIDSSIADFTRGRKGLDEALRRSAIMERVLAKSEICVPSANAVLSLCSQDAMPDCDVNADSKTPAVCEHS